MDNKERFIEIFTSQIHRPGAAELLEWLESTDFFEAPASTHYHGSYPGGLVEHSLNVYYELIGAGRVPGVPTAETYAVVALLHDHWQAGRFDVAQTLRHWQALRHRSHAILGIAAAGHQGAHTIAHLQPCLGERSRITAVHHTGYFQTWNV